MDNEKKPSATASSFVTAVKTQEKVSELKDAAAVVPKENTDMRSSRSSHVRMVQNFHLVWLDESIDEIANEDHRSIITKLRQVVNTVNTFIDADECIDFISRIKEAKTFMISSGTFGQTTVPVVHDMAQVRAIYIFCENKACHEQWATQWPKVKGFFTDITPICEALRQSAQECDQNFVAMSFIASSIGGNTKNLDELDQSFMYTQILKEILLTIDFEQKHFMEFLTFCREQFVGNIVELKNVDKLEKEYCLHQPVWWYTYQYFLYSMLNRALRTMEVDIIIKMGFFVRALHEHIAQLHSEQNAGRDQSTLFTVYRGQGVSSTDFNQLVKTKGGLMSFNNFLSTSLDRAVSLAFAESNQSDPDLIGVLFQITIGASIPSTPFAKIRDVTHYQEEEEILFSMHSIFRIGHVKQINNDPRLWQVELTLTSDNDPQLHTLTQCMREETSGYTGWERLGHFMIKASQFNQADELYKLLLDQTTDECEISHLYYMLGTVKDYQGKYTEAVAFFEKSLEINQRTLPANHPGLTACHHNIGSVYGQMGEYSKALLYFKKALEIYQKTLPANHPNLASSYGNIGSMYEKMGEYSKALSYYEKALEIKQKTFPANHPLLATSYDNIGSVYDKMGEYSKALSSHKKALEINQKSLPINHPDLATSYNNIGVAYKKMGEYSKALSYFEKALEIFQKSLPENHPSLAPSYNNIGSVYHSMGEHLTALSYYEKDLEISQKALPANHPSLAASYNNIGSVSSMLGEHSKAVSYCERALKVIEHSLPANHPDLQVYRNNLEYVTKNCK